MATKKPAPEGAIKARVLVACAHGRPNDVVEVTQDQAQQGQLAGELDPHPDAVAYAEALRSE